GSPRLPKVPRVSLERLELDLELDPAQPPVFRIFPGPSAEEFSVIVIEQGTPEQGTAGAAGTAGTAQQPHVALPIKCPLSPSLSPVAPPVSPVPLPSSPAAPGTAEMPALAGVSCCRVCGQAGAVVMCDRCQRCFHLHCHLPALHDVPSPEWTCLLCQELPPPGPAPAPAPSPPLKLSPLEQQRCEYVLLELLCHEPCRPLQRLSSS
ncbi:TIF1B factor, partial [Dasyornis broadbenti]|nr:TIF1B factor [Dasyornis broadbenti]